MKINDVGSDVLHSQMSKNLALILIILLFQEWIRLRPETRRGLPFRTLEVSRHWFFIQLVDDGAQVQL